ncbi:glutathione S-transferase family protein [Pseudomonas sp.]|uniref:glutathione S-transferase family protein n=1 Tax=Pseudomonas sp. TaxID=306 RepID=UPI000C8B4F2E|nr:glutathione S-transferase [Pseudomonadales bacterium]
MHGLTLYSNPQSRGRLVHWMLEELQMPYETVWIDYGDDMKSDHYRAINPMGKVPALMHGDLLITECAAICAYLADRFPRAQLAPPVDDPRRAAYLRWLFFAAGPLEQAITARKLAWEVPQERTRMVGFGTFEDTLNTVQQGLLGGPWLCGNHFTAADLYLAAQLGWAMSEGVVPERPGFADFVATAFQRPAALRAKAFNDQYLTSA